MDSDLAPGPLPKNRRRGVSGNDLRLVRQRHFEVAFHYAPTPGLNPPRACQRPQCNVAEGNDDVWLAHLDFTLQEFEAVANDRQDELVPHHDVLSGYVGLLLRDEGVNIVARRTDSDHVRDEALGTHDPGFLKHLGELLAGEAHEGLAFSNFTFARVFANEHDLGGTGAGWSDLHGYLPPHWLSAFLAVAA